MKISLGFISNSSSSSFIIKANPITFKEIETSKDVIWISDRELNDGDDLIKITSDIYSKMLENPSKYEFTGRYYTNVKFYDFESSHEFEISEEDLHKNIFSMSVDYSSTGSDLEYFIVRYHEN